MTQRPEPSTQPFLEWRSLFPERRADRPTYEADLMGTVDPFDERDCMFARMDLEPGSEYYATYYRSRPEFEPADSLLRSMPPLGSSAAPCDQWTMKSLFGFPQIAGHTPSPGPAAGGTDPTPGPSPLLGGGRLERPAPGALGPEIAATKVKSVARFLGADLVGIGPLNPAFVYSHVGRVFYGQKWGEPTLLDHPYAVSLGIAMDFDLLRRHAPGFPVMLESGLAYARAAAIAVQLAAYLRGLGYSARAHHLRDYGLLSVPVAVDGGLGELGRMGVMINRELGSVVRLATVTTDLPMAMDGPVDFGLQQYCRSCRLCAMACPSGAIPQGDKMAVRGVRRWKLSAGRCYHYWRQVGSDCALCLVACPWSRPDRLTRPLRPTHPQPHLDPATLEEVRRIRATLPAWLRKLLGEGAAPS